MSYVTMMSIKLRMTYWRIWPMHNNINVIHFDEHDEWWPWWIYSSGLRVDHNVIRERIFRILLSNLIPFYFFNHLFRGRFYGVKIISHFKIVPFKDYENISNSNLFYVFRFATITINCFNEMYLAFLISWKFHTNNKIYAGCSWILITFLISE